MTDDLVRQLRQASMTNEDYRWKAADLIERLRAALNGMLTVFDGEWDEDPAPWLVDQVIRDARAALKEDRT
jgi:hypothetical protein